MGLGREVADAYISVHGDLSDFRNDLNKAGPMTEALAQKNATQFADAWGQRIESDVNGKWGSILDAMYSDKKLDWDRLIGKFDANGDLDKAQEKISDFLHGMHKQSTLTTAEYIKSDDAIKGMINNLRDRNDLDAEHQRQLEEQARMQKAIADGEKRAAEMQKQIVADAFRENDAYENRRIRSMQDATKAAEAYASTLSGMKNLNAVSDMDKDFKTLSQTISDIDMDKFNKGFESMYKMRQRIYEVTSAMEEQNRITREQGETMRAQADDYIRSQKLMQAAQRRDLDHAAALLEAKDRLKFAQDRYNRSLEGMVRLNHFARMEKDFNSLAAAMASNDWRQIQRMSRDADDFRTRVVRVGTAMRSMGRMSDNSFTVMQRQIRTATRGLNALQIGMKRAGEFAGRFVKHLQLGTLAARIMGRSIDNVVNKIKGITGFNVVGDVFREGGQFIQNLDRNAVKIAKMTTLIAALGSVAVSSLGGATTIMGDLAATLGGLATMAPAYLIGAGIAGGVLFAAFKDMKEVLKDLKPAFAALQDQISEKFWKEAEKPIRSLVKDLMPTLKTQLSNTATATGKVFGALADAINDVPKKDIVTMFERMNKGIEISKDAMGPLVRAFNNLGLAGSKTFERFGTWIVKISEQFDNFIQKAADNGDLDKWIDNAIEGMKDLGRVIYNTDGIFRALGKAAREAGSKGLDGFANSLEAINKAVNSDRFQAGLTTFFEAFYIGLEGVKQGFLALGPGVEAFLPTLKTIMGSLAEVFEKIGIITSMFLANKDLQEGMEKFADGISRALDNLMPAIGPMATSLGQLFKMMGDVLPNITDLIAKIAITWGPIFDKMLETLTPLIGPLTDFAKTLVDALAPVFKALVEKVLPPLVELFKQLLPPIEGLIKLISPVAVELMESAGEFLTKMGDGLKEFNIHAGPAGEKLQTIIDKMNGMKNVDTGQGPVMDTLFKFSFSAAASSKTLAFIGRWFDGITRGIQDNAKNVFGGLKGLFNSDEVAKRLTGLATGFAIWNQELSQSIEQIFGGVPGMIKERWEGMWRGLTDWYNDVKKNFQKMMSDLLGFETGSEGAEGNVTVGPGMAGGGGGRGMSVGGKLDPKMFGLPDEEGTKSFFEQLGTWLYDGMSSAFARLMEALGLTTFAEEWALFWDAFPVKVQETWDAILLWITTKAAEIKLAVDTWIADAQLNWTLFWDWANLKVQEVWAAVLLWIQTKVGEIKTTIDTWIADLTLGWTLFWDWANTKVTEIWTAIKTWIETKAGEIKTGIDKWIADVTKGWDDFWNGASATVTNTWNDIKNWIDTKIREIKTGIDTFIRDVKTWWDNLWRDVKNGAINGWSDIVREFQLGVDRAVEWVRGLPGKAAAALGSLGGTLKGHGEEMINGFKKGLETAFENVKRFVGTIAQWIADNKGPISYDKVLLIPAGKAIMDGLGVGLRSQLPALKRTLDTVTATMTDAITENFARSKMYVAGADAALGLADGLKKNRSTVLDAFGQLLPPEAAVSIGGAGSGAAGTQSGGATTIINVEAGAIPVSTPTKNPELVASKVIDGFANFSNF